MGRSTVRQTQDAPEAGAAAKAPSEPRAVSEPVGQRAGITSIQPAMSPVPGWYPDPDTARGGYRYWNGTAWSPEWSATHPANAAVKVGTNTFAIASLVLGFVWVFWIGSILAIVFGVVGLNQMKRTGEDGRALAIAGIVLGIVVGLIMIVVVALIASHAGSSGPGAAPQPLTMQQLGFVPSELLRLRAYA